MCGVENDLFYNVFLIFFFEMRISSTGPLRDRSLVVVIVPDGLVYDLWVKTHILFKKKHVHIHWKRNMFDKYLFQKQHTK